MFERILLALGADDSGSVATAYTICLARHSGAAVHVVHVNEYLMGGRTLTTETQEEAAACVAAALREMRAAGVRATGVTYCATSFDVGHTIADVAENFGADVIVCGSHRRRGPALRRGVRHKLARATPLPILAAPAPLKVRRRAKVPPAYEPPARSHAGH